MEPICDFCLSSNVCWVYHAQPFELHYSDGEVGIIASSDDRWAACPVCYDLIQKDDREGIYQRSLATYGPVELEYGAQRALRQFQAEFFNGIQRVEAFKS